MYKRQLYNDDEELNKIAHDAAVKLYGEACLKELPQMMGSEDFAFFADKIPAVFGFLGTRNEELGMTVGKDVYKRQEYDKRKSGGIFPGDGRDSQGYSPPS